MEYIVFGTSNAAKCFAEIERTLPIAYFCDNDKEKWGTLFFGKKVISPAALSKIYDTKKYTVIIASVYVQEIGLQLLKMGIEKFRSFKVEMKEEDVLFKEERDVFSFLQKYIDDNGQFRWDGVPFANSEKMQYKQEITILIPTYKRSQVLKRAITYYGSINSEKIGVRLVILDASPEETKDEIRDFIKNMPQDRIRMPYFPENTDFFLRLCEGLQMVETEICAVCADDDFFFQEGLEKSVDFLKTNNDYFAAQGNIYFFSDNMKNIKHHEGSLQESISGDGIDLRIRQWNQTCETFMYMAYRTGELLKVMSILSEKIKLIKKMNVQFREYLYYILLLSWGKIGAITDKWSLRDTTTLDSYLNMKVIYDTALDGSFQDNVDMGWEIYKSIFPYVSKEEFLKFLQHVIYVVILDNTRKEKPLDGDTIKRDFENSNSFTWKAYVEDRSKKGKKLLSEL
jgi:glycosyltransferase domain-containing protein